MKGLTPKEKAKEIVQKIFNEQHVDDRAKMICLSTTKIALLFVDEILKNFEGLHKPEYCAFDAIGERKFIFKGEHEKHMTGYDMVEYWKEVKKEIEKL